MTSSPPCWWTKTKDLSLASFVRPPEVVPFSIVIGVPRGWLKTSYCSPSLWWAQYQLELYSVELPSSPRLRSSRIKIVPA